MSAPIPCISADSHIVEPPGTYADRIDPKFRDRAPRVEYNETMGDVMLIDNGKSVVPYHLIAAAGLTFAEQPALARAVRSFRSVPIGWRIVGASVRAGDGSTREWAPAAHAARCISSSRAVYAAATQKPLPAGMRPSDHPGRAGSSNRPPPAASNAA